MFNWDQWWDLAILMGKTEGGWKYLALSSSRKKEVLRVHNNQELHQFNIGLSLIVRFSGQITCIQGPSK
jgi:hypothetical protein